MRCFLLQSFLNKRTMASDKISVGFLGLGIMGTAMARNLLKSDLFSSVTVWNRTLSKVGSVHLMLDKEFDRPERPVHK